MTPEADAETALLCVLVQPECSVTKKGARCLQTISVKNLTEEGPALREQHVSGHGIHGAVVNSRDKPSALFLQADEIQVTLAACAKAKVQEVEAIGRKLGVAPQGLLWRCGCDRVGCPPVDATRCMESALFAKRIVSSCPHVPPRTSLSSERQPQPRLRLRESSSSCLLQKTRSSGCLATRRGPGHPRFPAKAALPPDRWGRRHKEGVHPRLPRRTRSRVHWETRQTGGVEGDGELAGKSGLLWRIYLEAHHPVTSRSATIPRCERQPGREHDEYHQRRPTAGHGWVSARSAPVASSHAGCHWLFASDLPGTCSMHVRTMLSSSGDSSEARPSCRARLPVSISYNTHPKQ